MTNDTNRSQFENAVIKRLSESGFLEIEIRTECLVRIEDGYQDEVINAGWHYWNAALAAPVIPEGWQDIATAPKVHRQSVILCVPSLHNGYPPIIGEAWWHIDDLNHGDWWWHALGPADYYASPLSDSNAPPTHWMPLPTAPPLPVTKIA